MKFKMHRESLVLLLFLCSSFISSTDRQPLSPRVNHVMLYVTNLDTTIAFYTKAFDLKVTSRLEQLQVIQPDGTEQEVDIKIALLKFPGQDFVYELSEQPITPDLKNYGTSCLFQHIGIDVTDIKAAFQRVQAAGGEQLVPIRTVKATGVEAKQAFFRGPDGELIELMEMVSGEF